jgi:hypothetical protein
MKMKKLLFIVALVGMLLFEATAQQTVVKIDTATETRISALEKHVSLYKPGISRLVIVGLTTFGYESDRTTTTTAGVNQTVKTSAMGSANTYEFSPMFLFRQGKKVLLEFEPSFNNDGLSVNWANISYFALPNVIVRGGYFTLPFGMYNKKLAAGWINKMATDPIGLPTGSDYGVGASGGLHLGSMKWNYDLSVTNGLALMANGQLQSINLNSASRGKAFTGRLGILPFSNSSLEMGVSGMTGNVANGNAQFQNAQSYLYAFDFNYVKNFNPIQINFKSQYNVTDISSQNYVNPGDTTRQYTFSNHTTSGYGQLAIRPIGLQNKILKNVELAFRCANFITPAHSSFGGKTSQIDYGVNYWINWRTVVRVTYEMMDFKSSINPDIGNNNPLETKKNALHIQFSIQL